MELPEEIEGVRDFLSPDGLLKSFDGETDDLWALKVKKLSRSQDLWHFVVEEDPIDLEWHLRL